MQFKKKGTESSHSKPYKFFQMIMKTFTKVFFIAKALPVSNKKTYPKRQAHVFHSIYPIII